MAQHQPPPLDDPLWTPAEVAEFFEVEVREVTRWANAGKLACFRTLGKHRRYPESAVMAHAQALGRLA